MQDEGLTGSTCIAIRRRRKSPSIRSSAFALEPNLVGDWGSDFWCGRRKWVYSLRLGTGDGTKVLGAERLGVKQ